MKFSIISLLVFACAAQAGDKCFCPPNAAYHVDYDIEQLNVVTKYLRLYPANVQKKDQLTEYAVARVLAEVEEAIPISPKKDYLRKFEFVKDWPVTPNAQVVRRERVQATQTVTKTLYGVVRQTVVVENGVTIVK